MAIYSHRNQVSDAVYEAGKAAEAFRGEPWRTTGYQRRAR